MIDESLNIRVAVVAAYSSQHVRPLLRVHWLEHPGLSEKGGMSLERRVAEIASYLTFNGVRWLIHRMAGGVRTLIERRCGLRCETSPV